MAILGSAQLDVRTINTATIQFGATGQEASVRNYNLYDVNADAFVDLVLDVDNTATGIVAGAKTAKLTAKSNAGALLEGEGAVRTVPAK